MCVCVLSFCHAAVEKIALFRVNISFWVYILPQGLHYQLLDPIVQQAAPGMLEKDLELQGWTSSNWQTTAGGLHPRMRLGNKVQLKKTKCSKYPAETDLGCGAITLIFVHHFSKPK